MARFVDEDSLTSREVTTLSCGAWKVVMGTLKSSAGLDTIIPHTAS